MHHKDTQECFLKTEYHPEENKIECKECMAYDKSGSSYVYQSTPTKIIYYTIYFTTDSSSWSDSSFGEGGGWAEATGELTTMQRMCTFEVGYDQPIEFDVPGVELYLDAAYQCCDACSQNDRTFVLSPSNVTMYCRMCCVGLARRYASMRLESAIRQLTQN